MNARSGDFGAALAKMCAIGAQSSNSFRGSRAVSAIKDGFRAIRVQNYGKNAAHKKNVDALAENYGCFREIPQEGRKITSEERVCIQFNER